MPFGKETGASPQTVTMTVPGLAVDRKPGFPPYALMKGTMLIAPHGAKRTDYYYWLSERNTEKVVRYLEEENKYAGEAMAHTGTLQASLRSEITSRLSARPGTPPYKDGAYWYYERYATGADYPVVARRRDTMAAPEEVMLDGEREGQKYNQFLIGSYASTGDGAIFAWTADHEGDRWYTLTMKDTRTGGSRSIKYVGPGFALAADNRTLFYVRLEPGTGRAFRLMRHTIATDPATDKVVYEERDSRLALSLRRSTGGRLILLTSDNGTTSETSFIDVARPDARLTVVRPRSDGVTYDVDEVGGRLWIRTNLDAPDRRIVTAALAQPGNWTEVVPSTRGTFIEDYAVVGKVVALQVWSGGQARLRLFDTASGSVQDVAADSPAGAFDLSGRAGMRAVRNTDPASGILRYGHSGPAAPDTIYDLDVTTGARRVVQRYNVPGFDPAGHDVQVQQATAPDGRQVPVTLAWRRDRLVRGKAPALVIGHGAFGEPNRPRFDPALGALMDRGFVIAWAHTRGGREMGEAWHVEGRLRAKANSFTDFIAVAEHLAASGLADRGRLFAMGRGAGGMLVGAVANRRPDLFKAIVAQAPGADILSRMLDDQQPGTTLQYEEWGNPAEPGDYEFIRSYSPYDQVEARAYPAMLVTASYNDAAIGYAGPAKWVARLRRLKTDQNRLIFRVNMTAGHEGETGRLAASGEAVFVSAFLLDQSGLNAAR
jgi:oligopeptidase B